MTISTIPTESLLKLPPAARARWIKDRISDGRDFAIPYDKINAVYLTQLDNMARTQILFGGSSSGKSKFKAQQVTIDLIRGGRNYLVCRQVARTIRRSVFAEIRKAIRDFGLGDRFTVNKSELIITCDNGYQILFAGLDDVDKLKSITPDKGAITDAWIEEATESAEDSIRQVLRRQRGGDSDVPKRLHLTFNPILKTHWIYKTYFAPIVWDDSQREYAGDNLTILKTTYLDNRFLSSDDIALLEDETDQYWYDVYTLGRWGVLGDVIFTNWHIDDLSGMHAQFTNRRNGLDFGFSADPAATAITHYDRKKRTIYIYKELYERELTNDILAKEIEPMLNGDLVVGDSSEPKSIAELRDMGINIVGAKKGPDSVRHGIDWLKRQTIVVCRSCVNMVNELSTYQWKKDRDGVSMKVPVDKNNHLIDALRYAYESDATGAGWEW